MAHQQELFGEDEVPELPRTLTVSAPAGRVLTKAQKTFNRLIGRIETLRGQIKARAAEIDDAMRVYEREVRPRLDALTAVRKDLARVLAPFVEDPKLKRASDREVLSNIVWNLIDDVESHEGAIVDDDIRAIRDRLADDDPDGEREAYETMRDEVESMFGSLGIDVDFSDFDPDTPEEQVRERLAQAMHDAEEKATARRQAARARPKTKKQLEKEARARQTEAARKRTIGTIYKQLAKTLHPDLEPDPERRREKLVLMQELTAAHRANALHTLLRLELEWLHREEGDLDHLTEEKLAVYTTVLKEQAADLEKELEALFFQPRCQVLVSPDGLFGPRIELDQRQRAVETEQLLRSMSGDLERFRGADGIKEVRALIRFARQDRPRKNPLF